MPRIYTKTGDDRTTGRLYGGRISKADPAAEAYGSVDETVAVLGLARALSGNDGGREGLLDLQREMFVVGADLATNPAERDQLEPEVSLVTGAMVERLQAWIDEPLLPPPAGGAARRAPRRRAARDRDRGERGGPALPEPPLGSALRPREGRGRRD